MCESNVIDYIFAPMKCDSIIYRLFSKTRTLSTGADYYEDAAFEVIKLINNQRMYR